MATEMILQYGCKVCGRRIEVTRTGEMYEEPVYCCGLETAEVNVPSGVTTTPKKVAARKPAKKAAKKKAKKAAKKAVKKAAKKPAKKKAAKKAVKKAVKKKKAAKKKR
jgi:hypothetical protein